MRIYNSVAEAIEDNGLSGVARNYVEAGFDYGRDYIVVKTNADRYVQSTTYLVFIKDGNKVIVK